MADNSVNLYGRIFVHGDIVTKTGLLIGGSESGLEIGGVDKIVIRDVLTNRPYIPGSSLRGKMRSLAEKISGAPQNQPIGQVAIHMANKDNPQFYDEYWINPVFGVAAPEMSARGERYVKAPTRLIVRDVFMSAESAERLEKVAETDLPYTEVKTEVAVDRVTSAATPRQMERVPAGVRFSEFEMIYSVYFPDDIDLFPNVLQSMMLLEDDYLGGQGSRGSGKIVFENIRVSVRNRQNYRELVDLGVGNSVLNWLEQDQLIGWLYNALGLG